MAKNGTVPGSLEEPVLILSSGDEDTGLAADFLAEAGIACEPCADMPELVRKAKQGAGAIVLAEESLTTPSLRLLKDLVDKQPAWSDLPFVLLAQPASEPVTQNQIQHFGEWGNVMIVERPLNGLRLVSTIHVALRARKQQLQVRQLIEQHETVLSSINDSFVMVDYDWRFIYVNQRAADMYGVSKDDLLGKKKWEVAPEMLNTAYFKNLQRAAADREELQAEFFHPRTHRWFEKRVYPSENGVAIFSTDITERKMVEENLRYQLSITRAITDNAADSFFLLDREGRVTFMNPAAEKTFGWDRDELLGNFLHDFVHKHPSEKKKRECALHSIFTTGLTLCELEDRFHRKDGTTLHVSCSNAAIVVHGRVTGAVLVVHDITHHKLAENQLKALNETLEKRVAERTKVAEERNQQLRALASELTQTEQRERRRLAHILHDNLQQMLVATKLQVGMLRQRLSDEQIKEALNQVEELLGRSIAESRSLTVELSPPILYDGGLRSALEWLARRMETEQKLRVAVECENDVEPQGDDVRAFLFQAVREFLFNTVKHAGVSEASVTIQRVGPNQAEITVADKGMGFDPESTRGEEGFGLFSIRERLEILGGDLDIESEPGKGTQVSLRIPLSPAGETAEDGPGEETGTAGEGEKTAPSPPAQTPADVPPDAIRVVLADDHKMLRDGLATVLRAQADIEVVGEAADGETAVELAHQCNPDVVIMDVSMPRLNGVEATRRLSVELPGIKVIGLSMHEKEDMAKAMREAGAVHYITKGSASETLTATIRSCCGRKEKEAARASAGR